MQRYRLFGGKWPECCILLVWNWKDWWSNWKVGEHEQYCLIEDLFWLMREGQQLTCAQFLLSHLVVLD